MTPLPRRFASTIEPLVSFAYFAPETVDEYGALGLDPVQGYFCARSSALGRATPEAVAAAFFNFNPELVRKSLRWDLAEPSEVREAIRRVARRGLERLLADASGSIPDVSAAIPLLREAVAAARPEGRTLFAAHAGLPWPDDPLVALWHGCHLLREFRGDGHVAVLVGAQVDAVEALALHTPYMDARAEVLYGSRGWDEATFVAAVRRLSRRGFLEEDGRLTDAGLKFREMLETQTDRLAAPPLEALGDRAEELLATLTPWSARIVERRGVPRAVTRYTGAQRG